MTPELLAGVFDLFVQDDRSLDRSQGGLGIGLTLVRNLVELHGGTVSASSTGIGLGANSSAASPHQRTARSTHHGTSPSSREAAVAPLRVLVVDDNRDSARTMAKILEIDGHHVVCAFDGTAVIDQVAAQRSEVILLDIGLPGIDGYQVAQQLRERYSHDKLTLIAMTGYGGEPNNARAQRTGFDHFLVKPVNLQSLKQILASCQTK